MFCVVIIKRRNHRGHVKAAQETVGRPLAIAGRGTHMEDVHADLSCLQPGETWRPQPGQAMRGAADLLLL